jgi:hypothetical protein
VSTASRKILAGIALAAGLTIGGYAFASAQSTPTTTPSTVSPSAPSSTVPSNGNAGPGGHHCDHMGNNGGGNSSTTQNANNTGYRSV